MVSTLGHKLMSGHRGISAESKLWGIIATIQSNHTCGNDSWRAGSGRLLVGGASPE